MKSLCLVTVGVLAMTLLIASISLLVAHVFQTVVDLQVKQVKALPRSVFAGWFLLEQPREEGGGWLPPCSSILGREPPCPVPPGWAGAQNGAQAALGKSEVRMGKNASLLAVLQQLERGALSRAGGT